MPAYRGSAIWFQGVLFTADHDFARKKNNKMEREIVMAIARARRLVGAFWAAGRVRVARRRCDYLAGLLGAFI
jgi:hypothetical protein